MYYTNDLVVAFIVGFLAAFGLTLYVAQRLTRELQAEIRSWRKEAINAKQNADWWQTQYGRDAK